MKTRFILFGFCAIPIFLNGCSLWPSKANFYEPESDVAKAYKSHVVHIADRYFKEVFVSQEAGKPPVTTSGIEEADAEFYDLLQSNRIAEAKLVRDRVTADLLTIADAIYIDFRNSLVHGKARSDTLFKVTDLALTGAAAALSDKGTKTALAAAATFLNGSKSAADSNFFANQTTISLVVAMDGLRAQVRAQIESKRTQGPDLFSISDAISMAQEYYQKGSLVSALISVNQTSAAEAKKGTELLATTRAESTAKKQEAPKPTVIEGTTTATKGAVVP